MHWNSLEEEKPRSEVAFSRIILSIYWLREKMGKRKVTSEGNLYITRLSSGNDDVLGAAETESF